MHNKNDFYNDLLILRNIFIPLVLTCTCISKYCYWGLFTIDPFEFMTFESFLVSALGNLVPIAIYTLYTLVFVILTHKPKLEYELYEHKFLGITIDPTLRFIHIYNFSTIFLGSIYSLMYFFHLPPFNIGINWMIYIIGLSMSALISNLIFLLIIRIERTRFFFRTEKGYRIIILSIIYPLIFSVTLSISQVLAKLQQPDVSYTIAIKINSKT